MRLFDQSQFVLGHPAQQCPLGSADLSKGHHMHERVPPRGWIERDSIERHSAADTPVRVIGAALCAYGKPTSVVFAQRGICAAMALGVLTKPNRSRASRSRKTSPNK
jgi:hypothetical protein